MCYVFTQIIKKICLSKYLTRKVAVMLVWLIVNCFAHLFGNVCIYLVCIKLLHYGGFFFDSLFLANHDTINILIHIQTVGGCTWCVFAICNVLQDYEQTFERLKPLVQTWWLRETKSVLCDVVCTPIITICHFGVLVDMHNVTW